MQDSREHVSHPIKLDLVYYLLSNLMLDLNLQHVSENAAVEIAQQLLSRPALDPRERASCYKVLATDEKDWSKALEYAKEAVRLYDVDVRSVVKQNHNFPQYTFDGAKLLVRRCEERLAGAEDEDTDEESEKDLTVCSKHWVECAKGLLKALEELEDKTGQSRTNETGQSISTNETEQIAPSESKKIEMTEDKQPEAAVTQQSTASRLQSFASCLQSTASDLQAAASSLQQAASNLQTMAASLVDEEVSGQR